MAAERHLVLGLDELRAAGLSGRAIRYRAAVGRLHRVHQAVYGLVPPASLTVLGRYRAAVLACGPTAALSHRSAADLHGLRACHRRVVEVVVPGRSTHRHEGIQVHRSNHLDLARDVTVVDGIPVTTVARAALDLGAVTPRRAVARALDQAEVLRTFDLIALHDQLARNPGHPGAGSLIAALQTTAEGPTITLSELEERAFAVCDHAGLPRPQVNAPVDPGDGGLIIRPDLTWRAQKVAAELDGARFHLTRRAFEDDRRRDQRLTAAGWRIVRITYRQLTNDPAGVVRLIARLLYS